MNLKKVFLVMPYDITFFPPIISLCGVLRKLCIDVYYIGTCHNSCVKSSLLEQGVMFYDMGTYRGCALRRYAFLLQYRRKVKIILQNHYLNSDSVIWLSHAEVASLFTSFIPKYNTVVHLLEFSMPFSKIRYRLLSPFSNLKKRMKEARAVICCEYNRAHITKAVYQLDKLPYILPNKTLMDDVVSNVDKIPLYVKDILLKNEGKKMILYQGIFLKERKLDDYIEAVNKLPDDYFMLLMGRPNYIYEQLKSKYSNERVFFLPFLPPPIHLQITKLAYIGILSYIPKSDDLIQTINVLYCAPNKIYEYSKFGIPMLSNDLPAIIYAFKEYKAGICINDLNVDNIISAIKDINLNYSNYVDASRNIYTAVDILSIIERIIIDLNKFDADETIH